MVSENNSPDKASIQPMLKDLSVVVDKIARGTINEKGIFSCALGACVAKSFEFTLLAHQDPPPSHGFFITATLRGICEDLIAFSYLRKLPEVERGEALKLLMSINIAEGVSAQSEFFNAMRPWQPVVQPLTAGTDSKSKLRALSAKLGWSGAKAWPSVWHMAKETHLHDLYNYLYSATSRLVHFSPQILFRMGWSCGPRDVGDDTDWNFTTQNFSHYYVEFNRVYSLLLLLKIFRGPAASLLPHDSAGVIDALEDFLNEILRWPEAVTYEELNLKPPHFIERIFQRAAHEVQEEKREST